MRPSFFFSTLLSWVFGQITLESFHHSKVIWAKKAAVWKWMSTSRVKQDDRLETSWLHARPYTLHFKLVPGFTGIGAFLADFRKTFCFQDLLCCLLLPSTSCVNSVFNWLWITLPKWSTWRKNLKDKWATMQSIKSILSSVKLPKVFWDFFKVGE